MGIYPSKNKPHPYVHCFAGCSFQDIATELEDRGLWPTFNGQRKKTPPFKRIWDSGLDANNTTAEPLNKYLINRKIDSYPLDFRFNPNLKYFEKGENGMPIPKGEYPALLAMIQDIKGNHIGTHRIYLTESGEKAPVKDVKKTLGKVVGGAVRINKVANGVLGICEGIEDAVVIANATDMAVWATLSASFMDKVVLPNNLKTIHIWADPDQKGLIAAKKLKDRLTLEGNKDVRIHVPKNK